MDYVIGVSFILAPLFCDFSESYYARDVFFMLGFAQIGYSLLTDYRYSLSKAIPLGTHMTFDVAIGIFVILAPWIYGYQEELTDFQIALHFIFGASALGLVVFTGRSAEPPKAIYTDEVEELQSEKAA